MMTHQQYLDDQTTIPDPFERHRAYYAQFVTWQERARVVQRFGLPALRAAFAADNHLNGMGGLKIWDDLGLPGCRNTMKAAGDFPSSANAVCVWKEAARQACEGLPLSSECAA